MFLFVSKCMCVSVFEISWEGGLEREKKLNFGKYILTKEGKRFFITRGD
jgi:hypothetical protein